MKMDEIVREAGWDWPTGGAPTARRPVARAGRGYADPPAVARSADKQPAAAMLEGRLGARGRWRRRRRCSASFCPPDPGAIIRLWNVCGRPESPPAHRAARSAQSAYPAPLPSAWRRQRAGQAAPRRWRRRRCGGAVAEGLYAMSFFNARRLLRPRPPLQSTGLLLQGTPSEAPKALLSAIEDRSRASAMYRTLESTLRSSWPLRRFVAPRNDGRFVQDATFPYHPPFRPFRYYPNAGLSRPSRTRCA